MGGCYLIGIAIAVQCFFRKLLSAGIPWKSGVLSRDLRRGCQQSINRWTSPEQAFREFQRKTPRPLDSGIVAYRMRPFPTMAFVSSQLLAALPR